MLSSLVKDRLACVTAAEFVNYFECPWEYRYLSVSVSVVITCDGMKLTCLINTDHVKETLVCLPRAWLDMLFYKTEQGGTGCKLL